MPDEPSAERIIPSTTRRQHHVWRSYLEAWASDGKIFCLQDGKVFQTNVVNVAVERDSYKLYTLTDADISGIRLLMDNTHPESARVLENFITMFGIWGRLKRDLKPIFAANTELRALIDHQILNAAEEFHARLEGNIKPVLDAIRRKDLTIYDDPQLCGEFAHFLSLQNLRTKGVRERVLATSATLPGFSMERSWNVLSHMMAVHAGAGLLVERRMRPLILLENDTHLPFITGDQPVINLLHAPLPGTAPTSLAFYYPVSPRLAVILDEVKERSGYRAGSISIEQVRKLNSEIRAAAHRQVFAQSKDNLIEGK